MEIKTQIGILTRLSHALAEALDSGVKTDTEDQQLAQVPYLKLITSTKNVTRNFTKS